MQNINLKTITQLCIFGILAITCLIFLRIIMKISKQEGEKLIHMSSENRMLYESSVTGNVADFKKAIEHGADVNSKNSEGQTPLCLVSKCRIDLVKLLVEKGADVNLQSDDEISPLHWAVEYDNEEIVEYLLTHGAKTDSRDKLYETPVHWAAWTGHHRSAKLLLSYGGDPTLKNSGGITPIDLANRQGHIEVTKLFQETVL